MKGFRTLSQTGARFEFYQVKKPSFNEVNSSNSTPNSTSKINFLPLSGSIMGSGGNPPSGDGSYYYEHKYSETMRQLNFQYVNDEVSVIKNMFHIILFKLYYFIGRTTSSCTSFWW